MLTLITLSLIALTVAGLICVAVSIELDRQEDEAAEWSKNVTKWATRNAEVEAVIAKAARK